jgi:hypothetical protein
MSKRRPMTSGSRNHKREIFHKWRGYEYVAVQYAWNGRTLHAPSVMAQTARGEDAFYTARRMNDENRNWEVGGVFVMARPAGFRWGDMIEIQWRATEHD